MRIAPVIAANDSDLLILRAGLAGAARPLGWCFGPR